MKNKKGFTLIELLVVVLIVGILASVALPMYRKAVIKTHLTKYAAIVPQVKNRVEAWRMVKGGYFDFSNGADISTLFRDGVSIGLDCLPASQNSLSCTMHNTDSKFSLVLNGNAESQVVRMEGINIPGITPALKSNIQLTWNVPPIAYDVSFYPSNQYSYEGEMLCSIAKGIPVFDNVCGQYMNRQ